MEKENYKEMVKLSENAMKVLGARYLPHGATRIKETPGQMFLRVAGNVAMAEKKFGNDAGLYAKKFYEMMSHLDFLPNSPTLMNAGRRLQQLSACFVLPIEDSLESIFETLKNAAMIHQSGGGTGFSFSRIRPRGDVVASTAGVASGPVSFLRIYNLATEIIKQGGRRRGANMGVLAVTHPDIGEFITSKAHYDINNFNISVGVTDDFMEKVQKGGNINLVNPHTKKVVRKANARKIFDSIVEHAWKTGDPGLLFMDEMNRKHPLKDLGKIEATNPCGEVNLLPYEACNLGSINLANFVKNKKVEYERLKDVVHLSVRFLDDIIEMSNYPLKEIHDLARANRKIGLGIMGFADFLIKLRIPYDSKKALDAAEDIMRFIWEESHRASEKLAKERGPFLNLRQSTYKKPIRNATVTTIAPTGTISIIANCSSGIEPLYALSYSHGYIKESLFVTPLLGEVLKEEGCYDHRIIEDVKHGKPLQKVKHVPAKVRKLFETAHEIPVEQHVKMQAVFQKYSDNAVSKTINLRRTATQKEVAKAYLLAYNLHCKGITVYRDGSKKYQVLQKVYRGQICTECRFP